MTNTETMQDKDIHTFFGLSYSNYLVLPRTLLQSMPEEWQHKFVRLLDEYQEAFAHVEQADYYTVEAAVECTYSDLSDAEATELGVSVRFGDAPEFEPTYYDRDGGSHEAGEYVMVPRPGGDPVPHYRRGNAHIEPRLPV